MCPRGLVLPGGRQLSKRTNSAISLLFHYTEWCLLACAAASARGLGLAVTRVVMVVMTTQPSLGSLGALGQRLWHGLITAPVCAEKRF